MAYLRFDTPSIPQPRSFFDFYDPGLGLKLDAQSLLNDAARRKAQDEIEQRAQEQQLAGVLGGTAPEDRLSRVKDVFAEHGNVKGILDIEQAEALTSQREMQQERQQFGLLSDLAKAGNIQGARQGYQDLFGDKYGPLTDNAFDQPDRITGSIKNGVLAVDPVTGQTKVLMQPQSTTPKQKTSAISVESSTYVSPDGSTIFEADNPAEALQAIQKGFRPVKTGNDPFTGQPFPFNRSYGR